MAIPKITTQLPVIPSEEFTKGEVLGKGGFGKVYLGNWHATPIAVKELLVQTTSETFLKAFRSEAQIMAQCNHPNIVRLFGICVEEGKLALIMEYLEKGSLYNILGDTEVPITWTRRFSIAADIGKGLLYLHSQKPEILHRDLKSLNILIGDNYSARITDFGFAKIKLASTSTMTHNQQGGTVRWTAPELFLPNASANTASDVYSFGVVLWEIASRQVPFSNAPNEGLVMHWKTINVHPAIPDDCPEEYGAILQKCWKPPSERPNAKTVALELNQLQQNAKNLNLDQPKVEEIVPDKPQPITPQPAPPPIKVDPPKPYKEPEISALGTLTYASNPVDSIPKTLANNAKLPSIAFGKAEWAKYFGDVGIEPPLPVDINAILAAPCPFWRGKKVQETHLLVLVPQTVNGKPLTLKILGELIQKPLQGTPTKYKYFHLGEYTDPAAPKSHWALMTRDVIEGSRNKRYTDQQALIKAKASYEVPTLLDATVAILMEHVRTGTRLYSDDPWTYIRCQEKYDKDWQLVVGGFAPGGLYVYYYSLVGAVQVGVGGLRKFF